MSETGKNKGGRPRVDATPVTVRVPPAQLAPLDAWIAAQPDPKPSRPEAIRKLLDGALAEGAQRSPFEQMVALYLAKPREEFTLGDKLALVEALVKEIASGDADRERAVRAIYALHFEPNRQAVAKAAKNAEAPS